MLAAPGFAQAQGAARYPLKAEDGSPIQNSKIKPDASAEAEKLPGAVVAANPQGDVTLVEFYDLNCPFCRRASADVDAHGQGGSAPASRAGAVSGARHSLRPRRPRRARGREIRSAARNSIEFHRALYAGRGTIDGQRALAVATGEFGLDAQKIVDAANDDAHHRDR